MPAKLDRCVQKVRQQGKVKNPWAVCNASLKKDTKKSADEKLKKARKK